MILRQTLRNHLKAFEFLLISTFLLLIGWILRGCDLIFLQGVGIFLIITALSSIYLHLEYTIQNRSEEFVVNDESITRVRKNTKCIWSHNELRNITHYMSPGKLKRSKMQFLPMESYHYAKFHLKDGSEFIITCLMHPDLEEFVAVFASVPLTRESKSICSIEPV